MIFTSPSVGHKFINPFTMSGIEREIYLELRLPRVAIAFFSGVVLSISGLVLQTIFKNPLVSPYTLGASGGSAFLLILFMYLYYGNILSGYGLYERLLSAVFSGFLIAFIVFFISLKRKGLDLNRVLLSGVALNFFFSAGIVFIFYLSSPETSFVLFKWLFGSFEVLSKTELYVTAVMFVFILIFSFLYSFELDLMSISNDLASGRGVVVEKISFLFVGIVLVFTAVLTSIVGPIGFVGIIVPNLIKMFGIKKHIHLIPFSSVAGGGFLVVSDLLGRTLVSPSEIPPGIITSVFGVPFFIFIVFSSWRVKSED